MSPSQTSSERSFDLLAKMTSRLASMSSLDEIAALVSNEIAALGFGAVWVAVLDEPTGNLMTVRELIDGRDTTEEMPRISIVDMRQPIGHGFRERRMINVKRPESLLIIEDHPAGIPAGAMALPKVIFEHLRGHPFACGPLLGSRGQPVGALGLSSYRGHEPLPDELFDEGLLRAFMSHLGIAMERALHLQHVERLNSDLVRAQDLLMQESRMRAVGELAAAVAHDLNNLSGIALMSLSALRETDPQVVQVLSRAERAILAIGELSRRLQRIARTGGDPSTGAVDLRQVVEDSVVLIRPMCREDGTRLDLLDDGEPAFVRGDQAIVRQAVMNLVLNARDAVKDAPLEGRRIEIRLTGRERVTLEVRDHGAGIPPELADQIFQPFVSSKQGHAGLGLATVRASMKHFGGAVSAANASDGGACFRLDFMPAAAVETSAEKSPPSVRRLSVLVVDDEPDFLTGMRELLSAEGHEVTSALDGDEAVAKVADKDFDVVLMDLGLPKRNGLEVIRALRGEGVQSKMVLMTGWDGETARADARAKMCDTILQKPFKLRELKQVLTSLFAA